MVANEVREDVTHHEWCMTNRLTHRLSETIQDTDTIYVSAKRNSQAYIWYTILNIDRATNGMCKNLEHSISLLTSSGLTEYDCIFDRSHLGNNSHILCEFFWCGMRNVACQHTAVIFTHLVVSSNATDTSVFFFLSIFRCARIS